MSARYEKENTKLLFDGTDLSIFPVWKRLVESKGMQKGWLLGIKKKLPGLPEDLLDRVTDQGQPKNNVCKVNAMAFDYLITATEGLPREIVMSDPNQNAYDIWNLLCTKYEPVDDYTAASLWHEISTLSMNKNEDPTKMIVKLEELNLKMKKIDPSGGLNDMMLKTIILERLPEHYKLMKATYDLQGLSTVTLGKIKQDVARIFLQKVGNTGNKDSLALNAQEGVKQCTYCKKRGHLEKDCWSKNGMPKNGNSKGNNNGGGKSKNKNTFCYYCKQKGHIKSYCPKLASQRENKDANNV